MKLNFRQYSDSGEALLILHGLFGNLRNWNWHARELAQEFAVYALDLRNHGDSPHADTMSYPEMAADVAAVIDQENLDAVNLLGHSMGGKVAMQLALEKPERIRRLLVADIAPVSYGEDRGDHDDIFDGLLAVDTAALTSRKDAEEKLKTASADPGVRQFLVSNLVKESRGGYRWRFNLEALHSNYRNLRAGVPVAGSTAAGQQFAGPVLFVKGGESDYIGREDWPVVERLFPRARIKTLMGTGHWLHAEKPRVFHRVARDFFTGEGTDR